MYSLFKECLISDTKFSILLLAWKMKIIIYNEIPNASNLIQRAALAARVLDTLPFIFAEAYPTRLD